MNLYLLKYNMLYYICNCPKNLIIPINDFQSYDIYKEYRYLYNKKFIAESQNLKCGTKDNYNINFDVIVRPLINLHGMGKDAYFLKKENKKEISNDHFWVEILTGNHISVDIFLNSYGILANIAFLGKPGKLFTFEYWEYLENYVLSKNIIEWINKNVKNYNGIINLEIIDNKIIECHLRMGDLNYFQNKELINSVILCYQNKKNIKLPNLNKIYLIPIFVKKGKYIKLKDYDIIYYSKITNTQKYILNYFIDPPPSHIANPLGGDRICNLTVNNLEKGLFLKKFINNLFK